MNIGMVVIISMALLMFSKVSQTASASNISQKGIDFIKEKEGFSHTRYLDASGKAHIGYGHLLKSDENFKYVIKPYAEKLLKEDLKVTVKAINDLVNKKLTQNQFDALASFVYNVGRGAFSRSTMLKLINSGNMKGAANEFDRWIFAGGSKSQGLIARRDEEQKMFVG